MRNTLIFLLAFIAIASCRSVRTIECPVGVPVDLGLSVMWSDRNYGAWTEKGDGLEVRWADSTFSDKRRDRRVSHPWSREWKTPSLEQIDELMEKCSWTWHEDTPTGYIVTGKNGNSIFMPMVDHGYWSLAPDKEHKPYISYMYFNPSYPSLSFAEQTVERHLRPVTRKRRQYIGVTHTAIRETAKFPLVRKNDGHYYFSAEVCGRQTEIMLESGIPALLVGRDFYEESLKWTDLAFETSEAKIRLLGNVFDISFKSEGRLSIGLAEYDGPVFVLEDFEGCSLPIQYLKDPGSGSRTVTVDLSGAYLAVGDIPPGMSKEFRLTYDKNTRRPMVKVKSDVDGAVLKGNLIVDFGNPMLMFLFSQNRSFMKSSFELQNAYNPSGEVVSQAFVAGELKLLGRTYHDMTIAVTDKYSNAKGLGYLGTPFFDGPVTFDFDSSLMLMK